MWNDFIKTHGPKSGSFLQTTYWGDFQKQIGRQIFYLAEWNKKAEIINPEKLSKDQFETLTLAIVISISFGKKFLYVPRGPVGQKEHQSIIHLLKKIAQEEKAIFIKIDPATETGHLPKQNLRHPAKSLQPPQTVILHLEKKPEELLAHMHPKTRYNIALARRRGAVIETGREHFPAFYQILSETAKRDGFSLHPKAHYEKLLDQNHPDFKTALWVAKHENEVLAGNIVIYWNNTATYLHGASSNHKRNLMAPYLLHWETILDAKKQGCVAYDFWGIDEKKWPGLTAFKRHFGDEATMSEINYAPSHHYPLNQFWYWLYNLKNKF